MWCFSYLRFHRFNQPVETRKSVQPISFCIRKGFLFFQMYHLTTSLLWGPLDSSTFKYLSLFYLEMPGFCELTSEKVRDSKNVLGIEKVVRESEMFKIVRIQDSETNFSVTALDVEGPREKLEIARCSR